MKRIDLDALKVAERVAADYAEYSGRYIVHLNEPRSAEKWTSKRAQMIADGLREIAASERSVLA